MSKKWQAELALAVQAVRAAAKLLQGSFVRDAGIRQRAGRDIKTRADLAAEECILARLAPSGLAVLAEETAPAGPSADDAPRWLVDPLDGTMNFSRGFPVCAVSVALWQGTTPLLGVVYDLGQASLYTGVCGVGAWRNGRPIAVSRTANRSQAILATGFPTGRDYRAAALARFVRQVQSFKKIRMIGSAALSLAYVAVGVFDAYYEEDIMLWDVAAGLALVVGAGGRMRIRPGRLSQSVVALATNGRVSLPS
ncbi:inositol monophosphatase [bacterium]|nr:inositol monophosphatase [bacterium]